MIKKRILVIDDEEIVRSFFLRSLKEYDIETAENGEQGLKIIKEKTPDLVFVDLKMKGFDGIEVLKRIKSFNNLIPVIMISAYVIPEEEKKAIRLGAQAFIHKPFDLLKLRSKTKKILAKHDQQK